MEIYRRYTRVDARRSRQYGATLSVVVKLDPLPEDANRPPDAPMYAPTIFETFTAVTREHGQTIVPQGQTLLPIEYQIAFRGAGVYRDVYQQRLARSAPTLWTLEWTVTLPARKPSQIISEKEANALLPDAEVTAVATQILAVTQSRHAELIRYHTEIDNTARALIEFRTAVITETRTRLDLKRRLAALEMEYSTTLKAVTEELASELHVDAALATQYLNAYPSGATPSFGRTLPPDLDGTRTWVANGNKERKAHNG